MTIKWMITSLTMSAAVWMAACSSNIAPVSDNGNDRNIASDGDTNSDISNATPALHPIYGPISEGVTQRLLVKHHKAECHGLFPTLCMLVRNTEQEEWRSMLSGIEGFEYSWGYDYELIVSVHDVLEPLADASSILVRLISTESKVPTTPRNSFEFPSFFAPDLIERTSDNTFRLGLERDFSCSPADCSTLESLLDQQFSVFLELRHPIDSEGALELVQIRCSDAQVSFRESCLP